jgi:hypothetical protein
VVQVALELLLGLMLLLAVVEVAVGRYNKTFQTQEEEELTAAALVLEQSGMIHMGVGKLITSLLHLLQGTLVVVVVVAVLTPFHPCGLLEVVALELWLFVT